MTLNVLQVLQINNHAKCLGVYNRHNTNAEWRWRRTVSVRLQNLQCNVYDFTLHYLSKKSTNFNNFSNKILNKLWIPGLQIFYVTWKMWLLDYAN